MRSDIKDIFIKKVSIENFKSYENRQDIDFCDMTTLLGANSSGKSTVIQSILTIKQTVECNSPSIDWLLSGKYITLGAFKDIQCIKSKPVVIAVEVASTQSRDMDDTEYTFEWTFKQKGGNAILSSIAIKSCDNTVLIENEKTHGKVSVNDQEINLGLDINNLCIDKIKVYYSEEVNRLFAGFLNELMQVFFDTKKIPRVPNHHMVSSYGMNILYRIFFEHGSDMHVEEANTDNKKTVDKVFNLLGKFISLQLPHNQEDNEIYEFFCKYYLSRYITKENTSLINKVYRKYTKELDDIFDSPALAIETFPLSWLDTTGDYLKGNTELEIVSESIRTYDTFVHRTLKKLFYLGPIREAPKGLYNIGFESVPKYVGTTGAYFASVLLHETKKKAYIMPDGNMGTMTLNEALALWTTHLNVAKTITIDNGNSFGINVSISNKAAKKSDIMNVGMGTSQILPVLVMGLVSETGETLLFEQPELHLHPYSQSRLADFFIALIMNNRKVVVETHSEYLITRLRYKVLVDPKLENMIDLNFFENSKGTTVSKGNISKDGYLTYPEGFHDETQELLADLIRNY